MLARKNSPLPSQTMHSFYATHRHIHYANSQTITLTWTTAQQEGPPTVSRLPTSGRRPTPYINLQSAVAPLHKPPRRYPHFQILMSLPLSCRPIRWKILSHSGVTTTITRKCAHRSDPGPRPRGGDHSSKKSQIALALISTLTAQQKDHPRNTFSQHYQVLSYISITLCNVEIVTHQ
jgi:hypothetical protein